MQPPSPDPEGWTLSYVANIAELVGLAITLVGFGATLWNVQRSKQAAQAAERAAKAATSSLLRIDSISAISGVIAGIEDIKRLHRSASWDGMPERYAAQRRTLISVKTGNLALTDSQKATLQAVINQLSLLERQVEQHLAAASANAATAVKPDAAQLNKVVSRQADSLTQLLTELKING